jgi:hypothetical protein
MEPILKPEIQRPATAQGITQEQRRSSMSTSTLKIEEKGKGEFELHTTLTREIRPERNWAELMERWQAAVTLGDMLGIAHRGFKVSLEYCNYREKRYDEIDRLTFYFVNACGWADDELLELSGDKEKKYRVDYDQDGKGIKKTPVELRQELARKFFDMLCLNFFKAELFSKDKDYHGGTRWEQMIISERLFLVIQNFFKPEKTYFGYGIRNLSYYDDKRSHNEQRAISFLMSLAKFIWKWKEEEIDSWQSPEQQEEKRKRNIKIRSRLDSAKPWMIEVLLKLDSLDILYKWILELDKNCLTKLKEIALRNKFNDIYHPVKRDRTVATLDEAKYLGSKAAWFLAEYDLKKSEHKRLTSILEAERKKEDADREIKKLTK